MKQGWEIKRLNDVSENLDNRRVPITKNVRNEGLIPYYGASGIVDYVADYLFDEDLLCVSEDGANLLARTYPIAFSISGKTWVNNHAHVLKFKNSTTQKFVEIYLNSIKLDDFVSGMAQPKLNQTMLNKIPIPLPPLTEQQRIVAILDEAFVAIGKAKANAERNLKNAKQLFESYLQGLFQNKGEGWEKKTLGEVIDIKNGRNQQAVLSDKGEYKILGSAGNVMGYATDYICQEGTTIIGRKGNISKPIYINEKFWNVDTAFGFYPKNDKQLDKKFAYYLCLGIDFKSMNRGTTIPSLVKSELQAILIHIPISLNNQQQIVKQLDTLLIETKKLEDIYQQKIIDLEELKKSILQKAFSGELKTTTACA